MRSQILPRTVLLWSCSMGLMAAQAWAADYFVAQTQPNASDSNPGTEALPLKSLTRACAVASTGDTVIIKAGTYREALIPLRGGGPTNPLVFRAWSNDFVMVKGSYVVTGFVQEAGNLWVKQPWTKVNQWEDGFTNYSVAPYRDSARVDQVFVNEERLQWVPALSNLVSGSFYWFGDPTTGKLVVCPPVGITNLNDQLVEVPNIQNILGAWQGDPRGWADIRWNHLTNNYPEVHYMHVKGLHFRHGAHTLNRAGVRLDGDGWLLEDCTVEYMNCVGVQLCGNFGVMRRCNVSWNGQMGFGVDHGYSNRIENCQTLFNNQKLFDPSWGGGGNKSGISQSYVITGLVSACNYGSGLWFDTLVTDIVMEDSLIFGNRPINAGIFHEASLAAIFRHNTLFANAGDGGFYGAGFTLSCSCSTHVESNVLIGGDSGIALGNGRFDNFFGVFLRATNNFVRDNLLVEPHFYSAIVATNSFCDSTLTESGNLFCGNVFLAREGNSQVQFGSEILKDPQAFEARTTNAFSNVYVRCVSGLDTESLARAQAGLRTLLNGLVYAEPTLDLHATNVTLKSIRALNGMGTLGFWLDVDGRSCLLVDAHAPDTVRLARAGDGAVLWDFPPLRRPAQRALSPSNGYLTVSLTGPVVLITNLAAEACVWGETTWTNGAGDWNVGGNWDNGVPDGFRARMTEGHPPYTVTYGPASAPAFGDLIVENPAWGGTVTLSLTGAAFACVTGTIQILTGAEVDVGPGAVMTYSGTNTLPSIISVREGGRWHVCGGTVQFTNLLRTAYNYIDPTVVIGNASTGMLQVTSGQFNLFTKDTASTDLHTMFIGNGSGGNGTFEIEKGSSVVLGRASGNTILYVGREGGRGKVVVAGNLVITNQAEPRIGTVIASVHGSYGEMIVTNGGRFLTSAGSGGGKPKVGIDGNCYGVLRLSGTNNMSDGALGWAGLYAGQCQDVNGTSTGLVELTSGSIKVWGGVQIGLAQGAGKAAVGILNISGGLATFNTAYNTWIGAAGGAGNAQGTLNMSGGALLVSGGANSASLVYPPGVSPNWGYTVAGLIIGQTGTGTGNTDDTNPNSTAKGTLNLSGGMITNQYQLVIGCNGATGVVNQTGGAYVHVPTATDTTNMVTIIGYGYGTNANPRGGNGTYNLSGGTFTTPRRVFVGGVPTNIQWFACTGSVGVLKVSGGSFTVQNTLYVGENGSGTVTMGAAGALRANNVAMNNGAATLQLVLGPTGICPVVVASNLLLGSQSRLVVDATAFNPGTMEPVELLRYGTMPVEFAPDRVTVLGRLGLVEQRAAGNRMMFEPIAAPQLGVTPASLSFGVMAVGSNSTLTFAVENSGWADLSGTATATAPFAVVGGSPYTVAPGLTSLVTAAFSPGTQGMYYGVVTFAGNGGGSTNAVTGQGAIPAVPAFGAPVSTGSAPFSVTFTDSSTGTITNRYWDFGDGTLTNTMSTNVTHIYTISGTYTVTLVVSGPLGASTNTLSNPVVVYGLFANAIPYQITFEPPGMKVGDSLLVPWNTNGWYGDTNTAIAIVTNVPYTWENVLYPVMNATHTNVLLFADASLTNQFATHDTSTNNMTVDFMVQPVCNNYGPPANLVTGDQTVLFVDSNGFLNMWNGTDDSTGNNNAWMTFTNASPLGTSDWARVTVALDYTGDALDGGPGDSFFKININGLPLTPTNGAGYGPSGHGYQKNGGNFLRTANPAPKRIQAFAISGPGKLDDFVVTTNAVTHFFPIGFYTLTGSAGAHGTISPAATNVPAGGSALFVVTADRYYRIFSLATNGTSVGMSYNNNSTSTNFTWSNVQATGTLASIFTAQVANNLANTPYWWLAQYSLTNAGATFDAAAVADQDHDGLKAWQEYIAGTDPANAASVFRFTSAETTPSHGVVVRWTSISNRWYALSRATNLLVGSNAFINMPGASNLPATPVENSYTDSVQDMGRYFYKIDVRE